MNVSNLTRLIAACCVLGITAPVAAGCLDLPTNAEIARCAEAMRRDSASQSGVPRRADVTRGTQSYQYATPQPAYQPPVSYAPVSNPPQQPGGIDTDRIINKAVGGAIVGGVLGALGAIIVILRVTIGRLRQSVAPKVKAAAISGAEVAVAAARDFAERNKVCPHCAEKIKREALVCKHCGRDVV